MPREFFVLLLSLFWIGVAQAATGVPFTVNMSEVVVVTGSPRIAVDVGGTTRYAAYTSGTGTSALVFTYQMVSGDVDSDGVTLISPIQLNGGTVKDIDGNNADLSFTVPNTSGIIVNGAVPSGYSTAFIDDTVTNINKTGLSFSITSPKVNRTYNYTITSSGGGTPVTGSGTLTVSPQTVSGINVTGLPDGILTLSVTLTDSLGGVGVASTDTIPMAVLTAGLVGHWTFDTNDISGATAYDRSGSGFSGSMVASPSQISGITGGALNFNGSTQYVQATPSLGASVSFSFWASWNGVQGKMPFAIKTGSPGPDVFFSGGKISWNTYNSAANPFANIPASSSNGLFHHYVAVVTPSSTVLYYDGVNIGSATYATPTGTILQIGGHVSYRWVGKIDDFRVYNTGLTPAQVVTLYTAH